MNTTTTTTMKMTKTTILAAVALVALASCSKENTATTTDKVAATFTATAITRVADNAWEANDQIGISMTVNGETTLADGDYENVPHTVNKEGESGIFEADDEVIYFPVDGSSVDFYAYYPQTNLDSDKNIEVSVATQNFSDIDIVAAKAVAKTKTSPIVTFSGEEAFTHQLSKLTMTLKAGAGIDDLAGVVTTIKSQNTTAKYNIYTNAISGAATPKDITAVTEADGSMAEAILIPTTAVAGSTIVFTLDGDNYIWDTSKIAFEQGSEHNYEITITKTGIEVTGATISNWGEGTTGSGTAE